MRPFKTNIATGTKTHSASPHTGEKSIHKRQISHILGEKFTFGTQTYFESENVHYESCEGFFFTPRTLAAFRQVKFFHTNISQELFE